MMKNDKHRWWHSLIFLAVERVDSDVVGSLVGMVITHNGRQLVWVCEAKDVHFHPANFLVVCACVCSVSCANSNVMAGAPNYDLVVVHHSP